MSVVIIRPIFLFRGKRRTHDLRPYTLFSAEALYLTTTYSNFIIRRDEKTRGKKEADAQEKFGTIHLCDSDVIE